MPDELCPTCENKPWSLVDKAYLKLYGNCWNCDANKWKRGELTTKECEEREKRAIEESEKCLMN